ncbi:MAG: hemolysin III family protein [Clostridia bacterium]|nr:hemolysin III family protein [Clostridia bacterium]
MSLQNVTLPTYSKTEEILNSVSHGLGIPMGIIFCVLFLIRPITGSEITGSLIFVFSVIVLYTCSMLYHSLKAGTAKKVMRLIDHSVIFIMITGTILALNVICVFPHDKFFSISTAAISVTLSVVGIILTFIDQEKYKKVQLVLYVIVGSTCIAIIYPVIKYNEEPWLSMILLAVGAVVYLIGMALYIVGKKKKYFHSIFHLFVLAGTVLHFCAIYFA